MEVQSSRIVEQQQQRQKNEISRFCLIPSLLIIISSFTIFIGAKFLIVSMSTQEKERKNKLRKRDEMRHNQMIKWPRFRITKPRVDKSWRKEHFVINIEWHLWIAHERLRVRLDEGRELFPFHSRISLSYAMRMMMTTLFFRGEEENYSIE